MMKRREGDSASAPASVIDHVGYEQLPVLDAQFTDFMAPPDDPEPFGDVLLSDFDAEPRFHSRRTFLRHAAVAGIVAMGFAVVDLFGRRKQVLAHSAHAEDFDYLQVGAGRCSPVNYRVTCSEGCYIGTSAISTNYCVDARVNSRHRAHDETEFFADGPARMHAIRSNHCYGSFDGWLWRGTDDRSKCGCPDEPRFSCSDGWARYLVEGQLLSWYHTTCQQVDCGA